MRIVRNLVLLCILLICQQYIVAQSYNLGKQKQSFAYETLYTNQPPMSKFVNSNNEEAKTTDATISTLADKIINEHILILQKLNRLGWQNSKLYFGYEKAFNYLIENEKWDEIKKVNKVFIDIFANKLIKTNVEKQLKTNIEKGIPEYQTFLQFYTLSNCSKRIYNTVR